MIVRKFRLQRGWSQEQLAEFTGLSVRTIQRLERGQAPGLETLKALAAVFEVDLSTLQEALVMPKTEQLDLHEQQVMEQVRELKGFYTHALSYAVSIGLLLIINVVSSPDHFWVAWVALGWGAGLLSHGLGVFEVFSVFGAEWERRQVEKRLGRKL
jgi:transcriptional regulator with XRE-family HTH domain